MKNKILKGITALAAIAVTLAVPALGTGKKATAIFIISYAWLLAFVAANGERLNA